MTAVSFSLLSGPGRAADLPRADEAADLLLPALVSAMHPRWTSAHRDESAIVGDMLVWPSVTLGASFDSNPFHAPHPRGGAVGALVAPQVLAEREDGTWRTDLYAAGRATLYPDASAADAIEGRSGLLADWAVTRETAVRLQGEVARRTDDFDNAALIAARADRGLLFETDVLGAGSVQTSFDRLFVAVAGTVLRARFDASGRLAAAVGPRVLSAETVATLRGRIGYVFGPGLYGFVEPAADWRALDALPRGAGGTRAVAGLGLADAGLLGGEVFGGWQRQDYPGRRAEAAPVFGGRLTWSPDHAWHVEAALDESLGEVAVGTAVDPLGTPIRATTATLALGYALTPLWRAEAHAGLVWVDYVGRPRSDRLAFAGLRVDYAVSRSVDLTGLVRITSLRSSVAAASYDCAVASLAATYHY